jgi:hypothetical protein
MLGTMSKSKYSSPNRQMTIRTITVHLPIPHAEMLNNNSIDACGYNKCLFGSTLEGALKEKTVRGEIIAW